ncbi:MAG: Fe2+-dependent dioxygenase [Rhodospirillales bacterium]
MLLRVPNLLQPDAVAALRQKIDAVQPEDGRRTGHPDLKRNLQLTGDTPAARPILNEIYRILTGCQQLTSFAIPRTFTITVNRYETGMFYAYHSDAALMGNPGQAQPIRTDLSFTLVLSDPSEYDGGEFHVRTGYGEMVLKEPAGTLICYPSNMPHRVETITRGARVSAIGWIQSLIRNPEQRMVLLQLGQLHHTVTGGDVTHAQEQSFSTLRENLMRMWAES